MGNEYESVHVPHEPLQLGEVSQALEDARSQAANPVVRKVPEKNQETDAPT